MAWTDKPPTKEELKASSWADAAPSDTELSALGIAAPVSQGESALRGAAQGATFGFAPAIAGAAEAVPTALNAVSGTGSMQDILNAYRKARDASKTKFEAAEKANPKTYLAGSLAGGLAPALLTGGVSAEGALAKGAADLLPIGAETAAGALTGAGYGALSGAGQAVSGGEGLEQGAKNIAAGAAGGALLGGAASKLGQTLGAVPEALDAFGNKQAIEATGASKGMIKQMLGKDAKAGAFAAKAGEEAPESIVQKTGALLSEPNDLIQTPVVTPMASAQTILERSGALKNAAGQKMGEISKQLDTAFNGESSAKFFNPQDAAKEIETQLLDPIRVNGEVPPVSIPTARAIQNVLDTVNKFGNEPIPFEQALKLKGLLTNLVNYGTEGSESNQILNRAGGIVNKQIDAAAGNVAADSGTPELADAYSKAKDLYGAASVAEKASSAKVAGGMANKTLSLTDLGVGAAGIAAAHSPLGLAAVPAKMYLEKYGHATLAAGAKGASDIMSSMSSTLTSAPKEAITSMGQKLIQSGGQLETSLGNVLVKAADRDDIGRNALMFSLMQNSAYRELLRKQMGIPEPQK